MSSEVGRESFQRTPQVDPRQMLAAVNDGASDFRIGFRDCYNWVAEHRIWEVLLVKMAKEGVIPNLLLDVGVDVLPGKVGGGKVGGSVARIWLRQEQDVPPKHEASDNFRTVKIGSEVGFPFFKIEGLVQGPRGRLWQEQRGGGSKTICLPSRKRFQSWSLVASGMSGDSSSGKTGD